MVTSNNYPLLFTITCVICAIAFTEPLNLSKEILNALPENCSIQFVIPSPDFLSTEALASYIDKSNHPSLTFSVSINKLNISIQIVPWPPKNSVKNVTIFRHGLENNPSRFFNCLIQIYIIPPSFKAAAFINHDLIGYLSNVVYLGQNPSLIFLSFLERSRSTEEKAILPVLRNIAKLTHLSSQFFCIFNNSEPIYVNLYSTKESSEFLNIYNIFDITKQSTIKYIRTVRVKSPKLLGLGYRIRYTNSKSCSLRSFYLNTSSELNCAIQSLCLHFNYSCFNSGNNPSNEQPDIYLEASLLIMEQELREYFSLNSYKKYTYILTAEMYVAFSSYIGIKKLSAGDLKILKFPIDLYVVIFNFLSFGVVIAFLAFVYKSKHSFDYISLSIIGTLVNQITALTFDTQRKGIITVIIALWLFACVIISQSLEGMMYSMLTVMPQYIPPNSLIDLVSKFDVYTPSAFFRASIPETPYYNTLRDALILACPNRRKNRYCYQTLIKSDGSLSFKKAGKLVKIDKFAFIDSLPEADINKIIFEEIAGVQTYPSVPITFIGSKFCWVALRNQLGQDVYPHLAGLYESGIFEMWVRLRELKWTYESVRSEGILKRGGRFRELGNLFSWLLQGQPVLKETKTAKGVKLADFRTVFIFKLSCFFTAAVIFALEFKGIWPNMFTRRV